MLKIAIVAASLILLLPAVAVAQGEDNGGSDETVHTFGDEDIQGTGLGPAGTIVTSTQLSDGTNLINMRSDFVPEMLQSVDSL